MCISVKELVPPDIYKEYGEKSLRFIDPKIISILKYIREWYNKPIYINTWHIGGNGYYRCLRTSESPVYKWHSCHSFGRAADFTIDEIDPAQIQKDIVGDMADDLKVLGLTAIEKDTATWTHISVSSFVGWDGEQINGIRILKP